MPTTKASLMVGSTTKQYLFLRYERPLIVAFFFQTSDALFATSKASCIIKPILDRSLHASNSARVPNYLSTDNPTNNKRCCQANEPKHQDSFGEFFYEVTKERHSLRAASLLSLNVLRFDSDLCELNKL